MVHHAFSALIKPPFTRDPSLTTSEQGVTGGVDGGVNNA